MSNLQTTLNLDHANVITAPSNATYTTVGGGVGMLAKEVTLREWKLIQRIRSQEGQALLIVEVAGKCPYSVRVLQSKHETL